MTLTARARTGSWICPRASVRPLAPLKAAGSARAASSWFWASSLALKSSALPEVLARHHASAPLISRGRTLASWAARNFLARAVISGLAAAASGQAPITATAPRAGRRMRRTDIGELLGNDWGPPGRTRGGGGTWIVARGGRSCNGGAWESAAAGGGSL